MFFYELKDLGINNMPCKNCNSKLIFIKNNLICPKCNDIKILDKSLALKIADMRRCHVRELWKNELKKIHRDSLICHILDDRDTLSWDVFQKPGITDIDRLFSDTLFIKRAYEDGNKNGKIKIIDKSESKIIIDLFNDTKKVETDYYLVESENAVIISKKDFDIESITNEQALNEFIFSETEDYEKLIKNLEKNNIVSRKMAEKLQKENAEEFKKIVNEKRSTVSQNVDEFIERNYDTIVSYYIVFLRNEIYSKTFDLREFKKLTDDPRKLMELVKKFEIKNYTLNGPDYTEFMKFAIEVFGKSEDELVKMLIYDENNSALFPLFVRIKTEDKDLIIISQTFTAIMFILLHAVISKESFDKIAYKRGLDFETKVRDKFVSLGFEYISNHKDNPDAPTLEIDGIASKYDTCFVIEDKNPRLLPELESFQAREIMINDLKGIIEGKKRTTKKDKRVEEEITSLPEKVEYVKKHLKKLGLTRVSSNKVFGIIVTNNYPLISEHNGYQIISLTDISNKKLDDISK